MRAEGEAMLCHRRADCLGLHLKAEQAHAKLSQ